MGKHVETRPDHIGSKRRAAWVVGTLMSAMCLVGTLFVLPATAIVPSYGGATTAGAVGGMSSSSAAPTFEGAASDTPGVPETTTIRLGLGQTILNFDSFNLGAEDTLNLVFVANSDRALIRVNGAATINGALNTYLGGAPSTGGQVTLVAPGGIYVGSTARVTVGGLIATTGQIADADFFHGFHTFLDATNSIYLADGAQIFGAMGLLGFMAPLVDQYADVMGAEALYGSAADFSLTLGGSERLESFTPHEGVPGGQVNLGSDTNGGSVAVSTLSTTAFGGINVTYSGTVSPSSAPASGYGYTALSAGGGLVREGGPFGALQPVPKAGAPAQDVIVSGEIVGYGAVSSYSSGRTTVHGKVSHPFGYHPVTLDAVDDLSIGSTGAISALGLAVASTDADFVNNSGADGITAGQWIVYSPDREGNTYGGLDSGNTALWGDTLASRPPAQVTGKRYVFSSQPALTFSSDDLTKSYGEDVTGTLAYSVAGYEPAEPGAFEGDDAATAYSGQPLLSADGAEALDPVPVPFDTYPITIQRGTLESDAGYLFSFESTGLLSVLSIQPETTAPVIVPTVTSDIAPHNGWYTADVAVTWSVTDAESGVFGMDGCDDAAVTADTTGTTFTCSAVSAGGTASESVTIKRDAAAPTLAPTISPQPVPLKGSATASPNATDDTSAVASSTCDDVETGVAGQFELTCTATDNAGNVITAPVPYEVAPNKLLGFFAPVDNGDVLNRAKAGQTIPLKWRFVDVNNRPLTWLTGVDVSVAALDCATGDSSDPIEQYVSTTNGNTLQNLGDGYYQLNWKSPKSYASMCKIVTVDVDDGGTKPLSARFAFVK